MTDLKRQQFEAHMRTLKSYSLFRHGEDYVDADTQAKWELWQVAWDASLASQQPADEGWIEWAGGKSPVNLSAAVEVEFDDGTFEKGQAGDWCWKRVRRSSDIIAYRVVKP